MDDASIYHMEKIIDMVQGVGPHVRFLPPNSPGLNPIKKNKTVFRGKQLSVLFNLFRFHMIWS